MCFNLASAPARNNQCLETEKWLFLRLDQSRGPTFEPMDGLRGRCRRGAIDRGERQGWSKWDPGMGVSVSVGSSYSLPDGPRWCPPGSRWDSVVSSVTAGEGWSGLMHNGGSVDHTTSWLLHWCGSSSTLVSILQGYWNINCCLRLVTCFKQPFLCELDSNVSTAFSFKVTLFICDDSDWITSPGVYNNSDFCFSYFCPSFLSIMPMHSESGNMISSLQWRQMGQETWAVRPSDRLLTSLSS